MTWARFSIVTFAVLLTEACVSREGGSGSAEMVTLNDKISCAACSVVAETLAFLPHVDDTLALSMAVFPESDSRGWYYAVDRTNRSVHVFGSDSRLRSTFGKTGRGPGEFNRILDLELGLADSLFVFEDGRVLVFNPTHEYVREFQYFSLSGRRGLITLSNGRFLFPSFRNRFMLLSSDGTVDSTSVQGHLEFERAAQERRAMRGAIGIPLENVDTTRCTQCGARFFGEAVGGNTFWSGSMHQYVLEQHDFSGRFLRRVVRDAAWFAKWPPQALNGEGAHGHGVAVTPQLLEEDSKKSRLVSLYQTSDSLLWAQVMGVDPDNPIPAGFDYMNDMMSDNPTLDNHFRTLVEVIDPGGAELLASRSFKRYLMPITGNLIAQQVSDSTGDGFRILRLSLRR